MMWTIGDVDFLRSNVNFITTKEIALQLNRSRKAVVLKCMKLGIKIVRPKRGNLECKNCKKEIPFNKSFCSHSCSAIYNNTTRKKKHNRVCLECGTPFTGYKPSSKYCNAKCMGVASSRMAYLKYINNQDEHCNENYAPKSFKHIFLEEQGGVCAINGCGQRAIWNGMELMFVLDHIDGNSSNNKRNNIRLVCPNCDSQLPTFKSRNKGNGRHYRRQRRLEGKSH